MDEAGRQSLEERIAALEKQQGGGIWDRASKVATAFIPAVIALFGWLITEEIGNAEVAVMEQNARVSQAELLHQFMPALTSSDSTQRMLAVNGVTYALTDSVALPLLAVVLEYDTTESVQRAAREQYDAILRRAAESERSAASLSQPIMQQLMNDLFSETARVRKEAAPRIVAKLRSDPEMIPVIAAYVRDRLRRGDVNPNGMYNIAVILEELDSELLADYRQDVCSFVDRADAVGPETAARADRIRRKLASAGASCRDGGG